jgi:hypothetical protein
MVTTVVLCLALLMATASAGAAESAAPVVRVSWQTAELVLEVSRALDRAAPSIVRAKADAQADLEARVSPLLIAAIGPVALDSSRTIGEAAAEDAAFFESLHALARAARPESVYLSPKLDRLTLRWVFPFFGARGLTWSLVPTREAALRRPLGWAASRGFTGLVIHAQGSLPSVGTGTTAELRPALFPRIWDENMDLVLEKAHVRAAALAAGGMVGYLERLDEEAILARAGPDPLRIAARAVFGRLPVDVVISVEAARQLLSVPQNVEALRQGRVCIVYGRLD